jgi:tRNA A-37 threonylcarbamoyl transferase component Bud32/putative methionine-R-sulfoxide reductase with GAF domain
MERYPRRVTEHPTPDLPSGHRLGRYEIEAPISKGAMGAVYRAHNAVSGERVAVKRLFDPRHAARFEIEARLLSSLAHPRVVSVIDHFQDDGGAYYLVMDLIEGPDLGGVLKMRGQPGLPAAEAIEYVRQAAEALQYVHDQQIVHRDVKPQNLIVSQQEGIVLVDFGVARELGDTEQGTVGIGTPRFMAPEVFAGGAVSPRSDVFGLAATLWTLLYGKPPVYADDTPLAEVVADVTPELEETIRAGLAMIPERRVASVAAFAKALGTPLEEARGASLVLSVPNPDAPRNLIEKVVRTAAGIFDAAAASIALVDQTTDELVFQAAWGAGAKEIVGVRLPPGVGLAGSVIKSADALAVADCRSDPRFAERIARGTGYVPHTMLVVPLLRDGRAVGVMSLLDRRDGNPYTPSDITRAALFGELALAALDVDPTAFTSLGQTGLGTGAS